LDSSAPGVYYTPRQIADAYGFSQIPGRGAGQTIAIIGAFDSSSTIQRDLDTFSDLYGIERTTIQIVKETSTLGYDAGWDTEVHLDVEWAHAMAPQARILLYLAKQVNNFDDLLGGVDVVVNLGANIVSISFGADEFSGESSFDFHFQHPGVTFVAATGDSGTGVHYPAASPFVLAVGGTSLLLDSSNHIVNETAWSGSSGGESAIYGRPPFQAAWQTTFSRTVPDVAYIADSGVLTVVSDARVSCGPFCGNIGTSMGAPQWAALIADINSVRAVPLGDVHNRLYALEPRGTVAGFVNFRDIVSGDNGTFNAFIDDARPGYDFVTGFGSPVVPELFASLSSELAVSVIGLGQGFVASPGLAIGCPNICETNPSLGTQITLTAFTAPGSLFAGWSGCDQASGTSCTVTINGARRVSARFDLPTITVTSSGLGTGTVISTPSGISCPGVCTAKFAPLATVTLTAAPAAGSAFQGWQGCDHPNGTSCTVSVNAARKVNAQFFRPTLTIASSGAGTVTSTPTGITCGTGGACSATFNPGASVTLTATAGYGYISGSYTAYTFMGWTGCDVAIGTHCTVTMNGDRKVTALFLPPEPLQAFVQGYGQVIATTGSLICSQNGESSCRALYPPGANVTLKASTNYAGFFFARWTGCDSAIGATCTVKMMSARGVTAQFQR
jgi:hypothetical protein